MICYKTKDNRVAISLKGVEAVLTIEEAHQLSNALERLLTPPDVVHKRYEMMKMPSPEIAKVYNYATGETHEYQFNGVTWSLKSCYNEVCGTQ